jgi:hypothetical protein
MKELLRSDDFFELIEDSNISKLTDYGMEGTNVLLKNYSGSQIKEFSGVSRSALKNYVSGSNRVSKRGQESLKKLIHRYNGEIQGDHGSTQPTIKNLDLYSDKELLEELKKRGFTVMISV